jgi:hypothetical protein
MRLLFPIIWRWVKSLEIFVSCRDTIPWSCHAIQVHSWQTIRDQLDILFECILMFCWTLNLCLGLTTQFTIDLEEFLHYYCGISFNFYMCFFGLGGITWLHTNMGSKQSLVGSWCAHVWDADRWKLGSASWLFPRFRSQLIRFHKPPVEAVREKGAVGGCFWLNLGSC